MPRLCRCGAIVDKHCPKCKPPNHAKTTKQRGYGSDWEKVRMIKLSNEPLCEVCVEKGIATPAQDVHHIVKIVDAPHLRLSLDNMMSVCRACHATLD